MRFQFRLEKILNLVRLKETMMQMELSAVVQRVEFLKRRRKDLELEVLKLLEKTDSNISLDWYQFQIMKVELDVKEQRKVDGMIDEVTEELLQKQKALNEITLKKKSLERIKEKNLTEFKLEQSRRVQKQLDEIYQLTKERM